MHKILASSSFQSAAAKARPMKKIDTIGPRMIAITRCDDD